MNASNQTGRIIQLDALRGLALLGIVLGNVLWFSGYAVAPPRAAFALDAGVAFALKVLVDGKFYALFSLLFGASFALMVNRERRAGRSSGQLVRRRLGSLFILGLAHATLVWFGDILSLYAVAALPLFWLSKLPSWTLLRWAVGLLAAPLGIGAVLLLVVGPTDAAAVGYGPAAQLSAFATGSYPELLRANAAFLAQRWVLALASGRLPRLLGMFALGVLLVRHHPRLRPRARNALVLLAGLSNLALALLAGVSTDPPSPAGLLREAVTCIAVPTGCLAYVSLLWPVFAKPGRVTTALARAGRLSLTHYLTQSLVLAGLFYGVGFGLWGHHGATWAVGVGGALALLQIAGSGAWLRHFGAGPCERLLRAMDRSSSPNASRDHSSSARNSSGSGCASSLHAQATNACRPEPGGLRSVDPRISPRA